MAVDARSVYPDIYGFFFTSVNVLKFHTPNIQTKWHMQTV